MKISQDHFNQEINALLQIFRNDLYELNDTLMPCDATMKCSSHEEKCTNTLAMSLILKEWIPTLYLEYLNHSEQLPTDLIEMILLLSREECVNIMLIRECLARAEFQSLPNQQIIKERVASLAKFPVAVAFQAILLIKQNIIKSLDSHLNDTIFGLKIAKILAVEERHVNFLAQFIASHFTLDKVSISEIEKTFSIEI